jgi:hypothetical protein
MTLGVQDDYASNTATTAELAFTATESGSTFQCQLDASTWSTCTSPKAYTGLGIGRHTFQVRAADAAKNTEVGPRGAGRLVYGIDDVAVWAR